METRKAKGTRGGKKPVSPIPPVTPSPPLQPTISMLTPSRNGTLERLPPELASTSLPPIPDSPPSISFVYSKVVAFQKCIQEALDGLMIGMRRLENELGASLEYESKRINDLENKVRPLETETSELKKSVQKLQTQVNLQQDILNNQERFSRRNNFRLVGVPTTENEDCLQYVENMLRDKFNMGDVIVERAHRAGRSAQGKSPHILVKLLSFRDKMKVMKSARSVLKGTRSFILDDLTKQDLAEKTKWSDRVQELYRNDIKLTFYAGKWRRNGQPYNF